MAMHDPIVIALGCNQGPRRAMLERACRLMCRQGIEPVRRSRLYWTRPLEGSGGPIYLNAAVAVKTSHRPLALLGRCQAIEREMGRVRRERGAPRTIDLDLIFYGAVRLDHPALTLPHPAWEERDFVVACLGDLGFEPFRFSVQGSWSAERGGVGPLQGTISKIQGWSTRSTSSL